MVGQSGTPGQGPFMLICLKLDGDRIRDAQYATYGCPAAHACGAYVVENLIGRTVEEAESLAEEDIIAGVGRMPLGREHCPTLAITALRDALSHRHDPADNPPDL